jgi:hypothetical protein
MVTEVGRPFCSAAAAGLVLVQRGFLPPIILGSVGSFLFSACSRAEQPRALSSFHSANAMSAPIIGSATGRLDIDRAVVPAPFARHSPGYQAPNERNG